MSNIATCASGVPHCFLNGGPDDDVKVVGGVVMSSSTITIGRDGPPVSASVE